MRRTSALLRLARAGFLSCKHKIANLPCSHLTYVNVERANPLLMNLGLHASRGGSTIMTAVTNIRWFREIGLDDVALVGGKNASLGELYWFYRGRMSVSRMGSR